MAYKRHIDRLPIIPKDAKEFNVTCHYCIVGCGYKAYTWPTNKQGGTAPDQNKFGVDLGKQQAAETAAWYAPSMYNIVQAKRRGRSHRHQARQGLRCEFRARIGARRPHRGNELFPPAQHPACNASPIRWCGATGRCSRQAGRMHSIWLRASPSASSTKWARMVCSSRPTITAVPAAAMRTPGAPAKLYFGAMKVKNIRIHNRPAYNSEVHATRDMGVGELNNCYEDAELADTIVAVGTNALETQTNYFLNHWVPNLRGTSVEKKKAEFGSEPVEQARIVIVDPRRTVTVNACEVEAGKDRVMHLAINSGTDLALFNAWLTYIADKGWTDKAFIAASTKDLDKALAANKTSLEEAARITGLSVDQIRQSAEWIAQPKPGGARRRTMFAYEKGLIWGNDNYRTNGALVNVALATGNIGRPGGGCVRMGGHQEGIRDPLMRMSAGPRPMSTSFLLAERAACTTSGAAITTRRRSTPSSSSRPTRSGPIL